jgi:hypothetical protein
MSPRAYGLVGDVLSPAELFPRLEALESMAGSLRARGLEDAAAETLELLEEARAFAVLAGARTCRLRRLWKAIEMAESPHTPAAKLKITTAALAYRAVREQGTRRT